MTTDPAAIARQLFATMETGWNERDGEKFASVFTSDADFVDIRGDHHDGQGAIAQGHQAIFETIYAGSAVTYEVTHSRELTDSVLLVHGSGTLDAPAGPLAGTHRSTMTVVVVKTTDGWLIDGFHNTLVSSA